MIKSLKEQKTDLKSVIENVKLKNNLYEKVTLYRQKNDKIEESDTKEKGLMIEPYFYYVRYFVNKIINENLKVKGELIY